MWGYINNSKQYTINNSKCRRTAQCLKNEKYPKEKDMIIDDLKERGADQRIIDAINKLESREYVSFDDLKDSLNEYNKTSKK